MYTFFIPAPLKTVAGMKKKNLLINVFQLVLVIVEYHHPELGFN